MKVEIPISWAEVVDSTNSWALRSIDSIDKMSVYAAKFQTEDREETNGIARPVRI